MYIYREGDIEIESNTTYSIFPLYLFHILCIFCHLMLSLEVACINFLFLFFVHLIVTCTFYDKW